jgi:NNP family nitrate/nitrite transporter-like MFS transporter
MASPLSHYRPEKSVKREDTSKMAHKETSGPNSVAANRQQHSFGSLWSHWGPVVFLAVLFFLNFTGRIILSPLLPTIESELKIGHGQAGFFFFLISLGYFIGLLGSGFFAFRLTHKTMIVVSAAGVGIALLQVAVVDSLWAIRAGLFFLGLAAGLYMPSAIATITSLIERRHWGKAIAVHELAPNLGFVAAPFLAELFLNRSTWRTLLVMIGAASIASSLLFIRYGDGGNFPGESPASDAFISLVRTPAFWLMVLLFGLGVSTTLGIFAMLPLYLVTERHFDQTWTNTVVALSRIFGPVMGLLGGWISDTLGPKKTMFSALTVAGFAMLMLGPVPNSWIGAVVFFQPALAVWFFPAGFAALAAITPVNARNLAVAFTIPLGYIVGAGAIPTFIGIMGDAGSFASGFTVAGTLVLCGGFVALLLRLPEEEKSR